MIASSTPSPAATKAWLPTLRARPQAESRLFCIPYAGTGASLYAGWQRQLPAGIEVVPVHLPGREERLREPSFRRMEALVEALATVLDDCLDLPYAFYGHSLGGWVSYYLIRQLARTGKRLPSHLFVGASRAPHLPNPHAPVHALPRARLVEHVSQRYGEIPPAILADRELMDIMVPIIQADMELLETTDYQPTEPLAIPISAFAGEADAEITFADVNAWREHTRSRFSCESLPGNHFFLKTCAPSLLSRVAREMRALSHAAGA
jgi:medium-chain acyl-[acyl-carrier-protein] hydrolase